MAVYRLARNLLAACQRGRREEPRDSPLHHYALTNVARGVGAAAHHAFDHSPQHRHGAYRRHYRRSLASFRQVLRAGLLNR